MPSTPFLQPLARLFVHYSTDFMMSLMATSSQWYHGIPSLSLSCLHLLWLSKLGERGLFFPSASYHANKHFVTISQVHWTQKLTGILQGGCFCLPWSYRWAISVLLLTSAQGCLPCPSVISWRSSSCLCNCALFCWHWQSSLLIPVEESFISSLIWLLGVAVEDLGWKHHKQYGRSMEDQWLVGIAHVFFDTVCWYCAVLQWHLLFLWLTAEHSICQFLKLSSSKCLQKQLHVLAVTTPFHSKVINAI